MATLNFNAAEVKPDAGIGDPLPIGWYNAAITESEIKPTKSGTGTLLRLVLTVLDGYYTGRKIYDQLNIANQSEQAQNIGRARLSAIGHSVGVLQINDSSQLHNLPLKIKVKISKTEEGNLGNDVQAYKPSSEQVETVQAQVASNSASSGGFTAPPAVNVNFNQAPAFAPPPAPGGWGAPPAPAPGNWSQQAPAPVFIAPPIVAPIAVKSPEQLAWEAQQAAQVQQKSPEQIAWEQSQLLAQQVVQTPAPSIAPPAILGTGSPQPWTPPVPVVETKSPEQLAWEAQQAQQAAPTPIVAPVAPVAPGPAFDPANPPAWMRAS